MLLRPAVLSQVVLTFLLALPAPVSARPSDLLDLVPANTAAVWSWRSTPGSERLSTELEQVLDAVLTARLDEWALDAAAFAGVPQEFLAELAGLRNVATSVGGVVPWRELLRDEVTVARTRCDRDGLGFLVLSRPSAERLSTVEQGLAGLMGTLAVTVNGALRYDITSHPALDGQVHQLTARGPVERAVLQVAVVDGVVVGASGQEGFDAALALLAGEPGAERLTDNPRALPGLMSLTPGAPGRWWVDLDALGADAEELASLLGERAFHGGTWQVLVNESLGAGSALEWQSGSLVCSPTEVATSTLSRFREDAPADLLASLTTPAPAELLEFVPADAIALTMRGQVDLLPAWNRRLETFRQECDWAEDLLWLADMGQATLDLWFDRDVLSWLGSPHVSMTLPSRTNPSARSSPTAWCSSSWPTGRARPPACAASMA